MSYIAYVLVILLSFEARVYSKSICEDDGVSIDDLDKAKIEERREKIKRELSSEDDENMEEVRSTHKPNVKYSEERVEPRDKMPSDEGPSDLKTAMEIEGIEPVIKTPINKSKREICDQILNQLREIPCDSPVIITCGGQDRTYPCTGGPQSESSLRAALSDVGNMLEAVQPPSVPSVLSPVQSIPISSSLPVNPYPSVKEVVSQGGQPGRPLFAPPRILTAEERRERQKGIFEGLLRFGTVVNHIDSFLTDKGKMIVRGLHRMVNSEEDSRFS
ncbi:hypothetical protein GE061_003617 [Apolygus lucorum]|uniref:Uncharacterized protein n=1 Tax=Apolygus lucorum TaxID=248454 RepID=A0A8S9X410_APOLU|nr:hypothetical protein GE061_003617 [Apolygus lucorum]